MLKENQKKVRLKYRVNAQVSNLLSQLQISVAELESLNEPLFEACEIFTHGKKAKLPSFCPKKTLDPEYIKSLINKEKIEKLLSDKNNLNSI